MIPTEGVMGNPWPFFVGALSNTSLQFGGESSFEVLRMQTALTMWEWLVNNREAIFRAIEFFGLIVGIAALMIAAVELRHVRALLGKSEQIAGNSKTLVDDSIELLKNSNLLSRDTAQIANSMSTQFIGEFPYNLSTVTEVLAGARAHVEIMVDIAAYGHYSSPEAFLRYFQQLERLAREPDVHLRMIVYDEKLNQTGRDDQFGGQAAFSAIRGDRKFEQYFAKHRENTPETYPAFTNFLQVREDQRKGMLQSDGAEIRESNERFRFFLWLVDDVEAVFGFQICGEHFREICFRTKDGNLIHTFADLFRQAWSPPASPGASPAPSRPA